MADEEIWLDRELLLEQYVDQVQSAARDFYPQWSDDLAANLSRGAITGLRLHAAPVDEIRLTRRRNSWLFFWRRFSGVLRPSRPHLNAVASIADEARDFLDMDRLKGWHGGAWIEADFLFFEKIVSARMEEEIEQFEAVVMSLHESRMAPAPSETDKLREMYLDIWVLGALLEVENERFLSRFPIQGAVRETIRERQDPISNRIGDCRIALIRMGNPNYRW